MFDGTGGASAWPARAGRRADVMVSAVKCMEAGNVVPDRTLAAIRTALEMAGVQFIAQNGGGPGLRLSPVALPDTVTLAQDKER